jgi:hypothetical protein
LEVRHHGFETILDRIYPVDVQKRGTMFLIDGQSSLYDDVCVNTDFDYGVFCVEYWSGLERYLGLTIRPNVKWRVYWATRMEWLCVRVAEFLGHN